LWSQYANASKLQFDNFNPAISEDVAAWETLELSALGSWVNSTTGQAAADEAQGDAQNLSDKHTSGDELR